MKRICLLLFACLIGCNAATQPAGEKPATEKKQNDVSKSATEPRFTVTPAAADVLRDAAESQDARYVRVSAKVVGSSRYTYAVDVTHDYNSDDDTLFEQEGFDLIIDSKSMSRMNGTTLDYVSDDVKAGFKFNNPNTPSSTESQ